jgi:mono/diheme cytochrome c family protein
VRKASRIHALPLGAALLAALACGPGGESAPPAQPAAPAPAPPPPAAAPGQAPAAVPAAPAPTPTPPAPALSPAQREAELVFSTRCATCHGPRGAGDGPGAAALEPKPRNFQDPAWQASVADDHLRRIIVGGGDAVGRSPLMPPNPDLVTKPEVVAALVAHLRGLKAR